MTRNTPEFYLVPAALLFGWLCGINVARAANGYSKVVSCSNCSTSALFSGAAAASSTMPGLYEVVSSSQAMTAYMKVSGYTQQNGWIVTGVTPVDGNGNSLANESESYLENEFALLDVGLFGTSRKSPIAVNEPTTYQTSFINSDDAEVGPGIDAALAQLNINWATLSVNTTITVTFKDGTTAQYIKTSNMSYHWIWNGVAHNAQHQPINRAGQVTKNPNTAGGGSGSATTPALGPPPGVNTPWNFSAVGLSLCALNVTVGVPGDDIYYVSSLLVPC